MEADLAAGMKNGYSFRYVIVGASGLGAPAKFELAATPLTYGRTGHRSFFLDAAGTLRGADRPWRRQHLHPIRDFPAVAPVTLHHKSSAVYP